LYGWNHRKEVLPYFKKSEDYYKGADKHHGAGGEWRVEAQRLRWEILDAWRDAAAEVQSLTHPRQGGRASS
jgi:choline dehydrogenase